MAISDDTAALVAAQLTTAWAQRMGQAGNSDAGEVGPNLLGVYRVFLGEVQEPAPDTQAWIDAMRDR